LQAKLRPLLASNSSGLRNVYLEIALLCLAMEQAVGALLGSVAVARDVTERIEQQRVGARRERLECP
jgi:hypothetical protein